MKPLLQFSHANGYPARCYRVFLGVLAESFEIRFVERFGHDPARPVNDGWSHLVDELIAAVESGGQPVIGVGHSLGGYLSLLAAARRPDLFRGVILLDAPLLSRFQGSALAFVKRIGLIDRVTPAGASRLRRAEWPSRQAAFDHFQRKRLFQRFDPRCLEDYVDHGTRLDGNVVRLVFDADIEYRIYRTLPHDIAAATAGFQVRGGLILGQDSDIAHRAGTRASQRVLRIARTRGGHLFPFQFPETSATAVIRMATNLGLL